MWTESLPSRHRLILATAVLALFGSIALGCGATTEPPPAGSIATKLGVSELSLTSLQSLERRASIVYEEQLALCMRGEGFDYRIEPQQEPVLQDRADTSSEADFVERHGWGIVYTMIESRQFAISSAAVGENDAIYADLSPTEREAYDVARDGSADSDGCETTATTETRAAVPGYALVDDYDEQIEQTIERFSTDLRIVAFHQKWSSCMTEFSFDYDSPTTLSNDISSRARGLPDTPDMPRVAWLEEMLEFEREAASASLECGVGPSVYGQPAVYETVLEGLEQRFLSENPNFLD